MNMEWPSLAAIASVCSFGVAYGSFWLTFGGRVAKAESEANAARSEADKAAGQVSLLNDRLTLMSSTFAMYREQVAKEYLSRELGREMEDRITGSVDRLGTRLDRLVEALASK